MQHTEEVENLFDVCNEPALSRLRSAAPGARLAVLELVPPRIARQAEQGEIDLAFHTTDSAPPGLHRRPLFTERHVLTAGAKE